MENGEMVAVCLDCFDSLRTQFNDGERYGIPIEKRQYNWMQIPPPPEDAAAHITTPQERLSKVDVARGGGGPHPPTSGAAAAPPPATSGH